jgi:Immunity protein 63
LSLIKDTNRLLKTPASSVATKSILPRIGTWNDFADPYVTVEGLQYHYVIRERGEILEDRKTQELDELLCWIFDDVMFIMAMEFEKRHRVPNHDFRRILFNHQLELLQAVDPAWRKKREDDIAMILSHSPFQD